MFVAEKRNTGRTLIIRNCANTPLILFPNPAEAAAGPGDGPVHLQQVWLLPHPQGAHCQVLQGGGQLVHQGPACAPGRRHHDGARHGRLRVLRILPGLVCMLNWHLTICCSTCTWRRLSCAPCSCYLHSYFSSLSLPACGFSHYNSVLALYLFLFPVAAVSTFFLIGLAAPSPR